MNTKVLRLPVSLKDRAIPTLLKQLEFVFKIKESQKISVELQCKRVRKISLFGQLLIYKFISYSSSNKKFFQPTYNFSKILEQNLEHSGFLELITYHIQGGEEKRINILKRKMNVVKTRLEKGFFITPLHLIRSEGYRTKHEERFIKAIHNFYEDTPKVISLTSLCMAEIFINFWEHATIDSGTVMVAKGNSNIIDIMFADNGDGIISTLRNAGHQGSNAELLSFAFSKGATSKQGSNHMGWGLWLVKKLCILNNGTLKVFSEGQNLVIENGKQKTIECGFWKGSIIHLSLPLLTPKILEDLAEVEDLNHHAVKINWV